MAQLPAGLGCRNTLRLEAKMSLYGHEIDDTTHALEADLAWIVKLDKGGAGLGALLKKAKEQGLQPLIAFPHERKARYRQGPSMACSNREWRPSGHVTSEAPVRRLAPITRPGPMCPGQAFWANPLHRNPRSRLSPRSSRPPSTSAPNNYAIYHDPPTR